MTRGEAQTYAAVFYGAHPAAVALLLSAVHGATVDERRRACVALSALDPSVPLVVVEVMAAWAAAAPADDAPPAVPAVLAGPARATADLLMHAVYSPDRRERIRIAGLLAELCREAGRLAVRSRAA